MSDQPTPDRKPIFTFPISTTSVLQFYTWPEAVAWSTRESNAWAWLKAAQEKAGKLSKINTVHSAIQQSFHAIYNTVENCRNHASQAHQNPEPFRSTLQQRVEMGIPLSTSRIYAHLLKLSETDLAKAAIAAGCSLNRGFNRDPNCPLTARASAYVELAELGLLQDKPLDLVNYDKALAQIDGKLAGISKIHEDHKELGEKLYVEQKQALTKLHNEQTASFKELREGTEKKLKDIEQIYYDKSAVQASVKYWDDKAAGHKKKSVIFAWASIISAVVGFGGLGGFGWWLFLGSHAAKAAATAANQVVVGAPASPAAAISIGEAAIFVMAATGVVWLIRILVRILLGEMHQQNSAQERSVMIRAYLSLIREKDGTPITKDDRGIILGVLFRPSSSGLVKEDGLPHPILAALTKPGA